MRDGVELAADAYQGPEDKPRPALPAPAPQALDRTRADGGGYAAPDDSYQAPLTVTDKVEIVSWSTPVFEAGTEMIGTGPAHIYAEIDQPDMNFILRLGLRPQRQAPAHHQRLPQGLAPRARRAEHRRQPAPRAHPYRAGGTRDDRGVSAAALPIREHVQGGPSPDRGTVQR